MARRAKRQSHVLSFNHIAPSINYGGWTKSRVHGKNQPRCARCQHKHGCSRLRLEGHSARNMLVFTTLASCQWRQVLKVLIACNDWRLWKLIAMVSIYNPVCHHSAWQNMHAKAKHAKACKWKPQQHYLHSNGCYTLNQLDSSANGIYAP